MSETTECQVIPPRHPLAEAVTVVLIVRFLAWLISAGLQDGGATCTAYSCGLAGYWLLIGVAGVSLRGNTLGRVVALSGWWLPAVGGWVLV